PPPTPSSPSAPAVTWPPRTCSRSKRIRRPERSARELKGSADSDEATLERQNRGADRLRVRRPARRRRTGLGHVVGPALGAGAALAARRGRARRARARGPVAVGRQGGLTAGPRRGPALQPLQRPVRPRADARPDRVGPVPRGRAGSVAFAA